MSESDNKIDQIRYALLDEADHYLALRGGRVLNPQLISPSAEDLAEEHKKLNIFNREIAKRIFPYERLISAEIIAGMLRSEDRKVHFWSSKRSLTDALLEDGYKITRRFEFTPHREPGSKVANFHIHTLDVNYKDLTSKYVSDLNASYVFKDDYLREINVCSRANSGKMLSRKLGESGLLENFFTVYPPLINGGYFNRFSLVFNFNLDSPWISLNPTFRKLIETRTTFEDNGSKSFIYDKKTSKIKSIVDKEEEERLTSMGIQDSLNYNQSLYLSLLEKTLKLISSDEVKIKIDQDFKALEESSSIKLV